MKLIEYRYSYHSWGFNKDELHRIDLDKKEYAHFDHATLDAYMPLPDDLVASFSSFFEGLLKDGFPEDVIAFDAPTWTFTVDEKTCTRIALPDEDRLFVTVSSVFNKIKEIVSQDAPSQ